MSNQPGTVSPDGQYVWDGTQWAPNPSRPPAPPPAAPPKKGHMARNLGVGCLGIIILIVIIVAVSSASKGTSTPATADKSPKAAAAMKVLLDVPGTGIKKTQKFTAGGDWDLEWSYDCANFGNSGNFSVSAYQDNNPLPDVLTNELGAKGNDVTHQHTGGTFYLDVNSECAWHLVVKG